MAASQHAEFMRRAIALSRRASIEEKTGGVFGAVIDRLDFYNDHIIYKQIYPVSTIKMHLFITQWSLYLSLNLQPLLP